MSTLQNTQNLWTNIQTQDLDSKYEKCRNITEEIYKRINITFQIKKLESSAQSDLSDLSDQVDSNELSNETDLFACDKTSISSSTELEALEHGSAACEKFINNNNNNIEDNKLNKPVTVYKRPRKRFRKRVKKQPLTKQDSDGSSDEAPLSQVADLDGIAKSSRSDRVAASPSHAIMGVPNIVIIPIDWKKFKSPTTDNKPETKSPKSSPDKTSNKTKNIADKAQTKKSAIEKPTTDKTAIEPGHRQKDDDLSKKEKLPTEWQCSMCSLSFKGERGLRRHMTMSHITSPDEVKKSMKTHRDEPT